MHPHSNACLLLVQRSPGMASCPPYIFYGPAHGQGGPGGHGSPFRHLSVPPQHRHTHVDYQGLHWLRCRRSQGRHPCHAAINDIVKQSLTSAGVPSHLEPSGICRQMAKDLMEPQSCHGKLAGSWCGTQLVQLVPAYPQFLTDGDALDG